MFRKKGAGAGGADRSWMKRKPHPFVQRTGEPGARAGLGFGGKCRAFTLVELMAAMAVSALLMALLFTVVHQVSRTTRRATSSTSAFDEARMAFAEMKRHLGQATLSPYWNVSYDGGGNPSGYYRMSDLHFVCGAAQTLVPSSRGGESVHAVGDAIFFQAATGFNPWTGGEGAALNAEGFFVEFRNVSKDLPLGGTLAPAKWRFQLRLFRQPASQLKVFDPTAAATPMKWFQTPLADAEAPVTTLADNVALLIIRVRNTEGSSETFYFDYNSRSWTGSGPQPSTSHQLPPVVDLVMLALDPQVVERMDQGTAMPQLVKPGLFDTPSKLDEDVAELERDLAAKYPESGFRVFRATVPIRSAKWSIDSIQP